jgi:hypothetical protein
MSGNGGFQYVAWMHGNLVVSTHQIDVGEVATTREEVGVIVDVTYGITVKDGSDVKSSTVTAWTPTVVLLGQYMESRRPGSLGAASCAVPQ